MSFRKGLFSILAVLASFSASAYVLEPVEPTFQDYSSLLSAAGYELYSFDISGLVDDQYRIEIKVREYAGDSLVNGNVTGFSSIFSNRTMLTDFDLEDQKNIKPENMYDAEKGIYSAAEKINVGFLPVSDAKDGGKRISCLFELPDMGTRIYHLNLQPQYAPDSTEPFFSYSTRPFITTEWKENEYIPLVLLGSFWYDQKYNVFRFCGENKISPDMSSTILKYVPHYYVIGITLTKKQK